MTTTKGDWQRVSKRRPCPVCGKADWCTFQGPADNPETVCCMRTESDKPTKNGGWLHRLRDSDDWRPTRRRIVPATKPPEEKPVIDFAAMARSCELAATPEALGQLADSLGLTRDSLQRLRVGWSGRHRAWSFPMSDAAGEVVGIRLRLPDGRKLSVKGGREGLFIPTGLQPGNLLICEGPTDAAALLDFGGVAIGRPNCSGGVKHLVELVRRLRPEEIAIIADADLPGQRGAVTLADRLAAYVPSVRIVTPPADVKDARAWKQSGLTPTGLVWAIEQAPIRRLAVTTVTRRRKARVTYGR